MLALTIFAAGRAYSLTISHRVKELEAVMSMLKYLSAEIRYLMAPIQDIIKNLSRKSELLPLKFLEVCRTNIDNGEDFPTAWKKAIDDYRQVGQLKDDDLRLLYSLGEEIGTTDLTGQEGVCNMYSELIDIKLQEARCYESKYKEFYSALGILGGLAVIIILI